MEIHVLQTEVCLLWGIFCSFFTSTDPLLN